MVAQNISPGTGAGMWSPRLLINATPPAQVWSTLSLTFGKI